MFLQNLYSKKSATLGSGDLHQRLNVHFKHPCSFIHSAVFSCLKDLSQEVLSVWAKGKDHTIPSSFHLCESLIWIGISTIGPGFTKHDTKTLLNIALQVKKLFKLQVKNKTDSMKIIFPPPYSFYTAKQMVRTMVQIPPRIYSHISLLTWSRKKIIPIMFLYKTVTAKSHIYDVLSIYAFHFSCYIIHFLGK